MCLLCELKKNSLIFAQIIFAQIIGEMMMMVVEARSRR